MRLIGLYFRLLRSVADVEASESLLEKCSMSNDHDSRSAQHDELENLCRQEEKSAPSSAQADKRIEVSFEQFVSEVTDYAIFLLDPQGRVVTWNAGAQRIKGYKANEIVGQHLSAFYTREAIERGWPQHELECARREGRFEDEGWRVCKDGSRFWANVVITALRNEAGSLLGFSKITRDLTERKQGEEAIRAANVDLEEQVRRRTAELQHVVEDLARSNADLEQFAYVASHDLQEPLRAVTGCVQILQKRYHGKLDTRADELIVHTIEGVQRMQTLIGDLLTYSRVSTRGQQFGPTDCNAVLKSALANLAVSIAESGAIVTSGDLPIMAGDSAQMAMVFQNLIGNAVKFRGVERPEIHIDVQRQEGDWLFSVRDNGIGIERDYFDRIFVIFQRLHTRKHSPGTGIGLAICKKVIERHGGRIWVESKPGMGTTFLFTVPVSGETPP